MIPVYDRNWTDIFDIIEKRVHELTKTLETCKPSECEDSVKDSGKCNLNLLSVIENGDFQCN